MKMTRSMKKRKATSSSFSWKQREEENERKLLDENEFSFLIDPLLRKKRSALQKKINSRKKKYKKSFVSWKNWKREKQRVLTFERLKIVGIFSSSDVSRVF